MTTKTLTQLAQDLEAAGIHAALDLGACDDASSLAVSGAACDSRAVRPGDLFVCKGAAFRPAFLASARKVGAAAYLVAADKAAELAPAAQGLPALVVDASDLRRAMAICSAEAFGRPDRSLPIVGITGTKGKTTCAYMLRSIVDAARGKGSCGIIGTVETYDGVEDGASRNTTPESPDLWRHLSNARGANLGSLVMEVSSQALKYDRSYGVELALGCFLNIGLDHISAVEHKDFADYFGSKLRIFEQCRTAVVNLDSDHVDEVLAAARAGSAERVITFGLERPDADAWASDLAPSELGISFTLHLGGEERAASLPFPGDFSVENALCAAVCAHELGLSINQIVSGLAVTRVPGRMEFYRSADGRLTGVVDYAHNRMAFNSLLGAIAKTYADAEKIAVFGAVGGKAVERRHDLPDAASQFVDRVILTTDDPWTEDPADICREMEASLPEGFPHEIVIDREKAAARAFELAESSGKRAVVLLLAKGVETTQHVANGYAPVTSDADLAAHYVADYDARHGA